MMDFYVFQQFTPIRLNEKDAEGNDLHAANLIRVGRVKASDGAAALSECRGWSRFNQRSRTSLMHYPIVEERNDRSSDD